MTDARRPIFLATFLTAMAGLSTATLAADGPADSDARVAALQAEKNRIDARITRIQNDRNPDWLNGQQTEELRALIEDIVAQNASRASLIGDGMNAGWNKGFFLKNDDSSFLLKVKGQTQFRYIWNSKDSPDKNTASFEIRRAKLEFSGNIYSKDLKYKVKGAFNRNSGVFDLEDAYGQYALGHGWRVKWGQYKPAFNTEETISSSKQLAVDRSVPNEIANLGFSQGVEIAHKGETLAFAFGFTDGATLRAAGTSSSRANTRFSNDTTEWAVNARVDGLLAGQWKQFADFTSWSSDETGIKIGAGVFAQDGEYGTTGEEVQWYQWTADAQLEFGGSNLFTALFGRHTNPNADVTPSFDQLGLVVQGGIHIVPDKWEIFGRYEWFDFDGAVVNDYSAVTLGFNHYFHKHAWKWTSDIVWSLDPVPFSVTGAGLLGDTGTDEDQIALRTQIQMLF